MKITVRMCFIVGCMFATMISYAEQENRSPKDWYQGSNAYASLKCSIEFKMIQVGGEGDLQKCVSDGKIEIKKSAKAALKEHYIAAISGLQGIEPQSDERKINYEKRQGDNKNKIEEMWIRFETEN